MATYKGDIRYRAKCFKCKAPMGDAALNFPIEKRLCWDCRPHDFNKAVEKYKK